MLGPKVAAPFETYWMLGAATVMVEASGTATLVKAEFVDFTAAMELERRPGLAAIDDAAAVATEACAAGTWEMNSTHVEPDGHAV